ncbi:DDB1- and CUL4-associated factor 10 homolog [Dendronephthya gigantea]|uniref:DDB1- and CUL4-associated factor 10 homolog n=1 Tax=Dendronephthya gigantea TaxID=151771 RepID=UPI00106971D0|nr:DDB1- and CUL4-associated factor 10 homolog [Dendronephthya gigantea]
MRRYSTIEMCRQREIGLLSLTCDTLTSRYYKHFKRSSSIYNITLGRGGVFSLEFSPSGKMLAAACEQNTVSLYDPNTRKCLHQISDAHNDAVNSICFCDERIFATGSDDCTIALWDARKLGENVMRLAGHTDWVKSLAYDCKTRLLLSSAFDGTIRTWDINKSTYSENELHEIGQKLFTNESGISRMELSHAGDKLIMSCFSQIDHHDEILLVHNLDLEHFSEDLQATENNVDAKNDYRNNLSVINGNYEFTVPPLYIPSFAVHPDGSCLVSRYLTAVYDYTTVHDIQYDSSCKERRLSHYIQESEAGPGFIKDQSFSPDGRVIASPFAHGVRILAFDSECSLWRKDTIIKPLKEVKSLFGHPMPVCCCKFSPTHMLLVTGCLGQKVVFHEPKL